jgi:DNA processing protein
MDRQELAAWLRLSLTPGVGNSSARKLLAAFGLPADIFAQSQSTLATVVSTAQATALMREPPETAELLATTWDWLQAEPESHRVLTLGDELYPQSLLNIEDPPLLLYGKGMPQAWQRNLLNAKDTRAIAVVGSRNPSPQGAANARQFSQALAEAGLCIVSGLALGIDGAAHEGAIAGASETALATVAVVGTGLDRVYPARHRELAHRIAQRGMLLSEYALGTSPLAANFPRRNRIISGLSIGTLVAEAALQSGSLITARLAVEQGRDVFAIPGSIHSTQSRGCHALIKQGAKLVESAQDVLEELQSTVAWTEYSDADQGQSAVPSEQPFDGDDSALVQALGFEPVALDGLQARTGLPTADLLAQLMTLELQGVVARLPGGLFQRMARA